MSTDIMHMLLILPGIIVGLAFHEYAHARVAVWLGDDTPKLQGRLSLNPTVHLDAFGFIALLFAGFGWAKPVRINPLNFKHKRRDDLLVSLAGPMMNLLVAIFFTFLMKGLILMSYRIPSQDLLQTILDVFNYTVWINITLMIFNLIPLPPLDGFHVLSSLLNLSSHPRYYDFYTKGRLILLIMILSSYFTHISIIGRIIGTPIEFVVRFIQQLIIY